MALYGVHAGAGFPDGEWRCAGVGVFGGFASFELRPYKRIGRDAGGHFFAAEINQTSRAINSTCLRRCAPRNELYGDVAINPADVRTSARGEPVAVGRVGRELQTRADLWRDLEKLTESTPAGRL